MQCVDQWLASRRLCPCCKHDASQPLPVPESGDGRSASGDDGEDGGGDVPGSDALVRVWSRVVSALGFQGARGAAGAQQPQAPPVLTAQAVAATAPAASSGQEAPLSTHVPAGAVVFVPPVQQQAAGVAAGDNVAGGAGRGGWSRRAGFLRLLSSPPWMWAGGRGAGEAGDREGAELQRPLLAEEEQVGDVEAPASAGAASRAGGAGRSGARADGSGVGDGDRGQAGASTQAHMLSGGSERRGDDNQSAAAAVAAGGSPSTPPLASSVLGRPRQSRPSEGSEISEC